MKAKECDNIMTILFDIPLARNYGAMRDAAHQKPSSFCSHHAIVRQCSYWIENSDNDLQRAAASLSIQDDEMIHQQIAGEFANEQAILDRSHEEMYNAYCAAIFRNNGGIYTSAGSPEKDYCVASGYDSDGLYHRVITSRHYNRINLKHIVDFSYTSKSYRPPPMNENSRVYQEYVRMEECLSKYNAILDEMNKSTNLTDENFDNGEYKDHLDTAFWSTQGAQIRETVNFLFDGYWKDVNAAVEAIDSTVFTQGNAAARCFADLRGIVMPASEDIPAQREGDISDVRNERPLAEDLELVTRNWAIVKAAEYESTDAGNTLYSTKDIIACSAGEEIKHHNSGIFISALGQQNKMKGSRAFDPSAPSRYVILAKTRNYRQIGRLIDRVERLGVYGTMALRDHRKLRLAGEEVQQIGEALDRAEKFINDRQRYRRFVDDIGRRIEEIGDDIEGGISYRVYVVTYYARIMRELVETMRFQKIQGFETYEEFCRRQLYQIYEFNEELGARIGRLRSRHSAIIAREQNYELNTLNKEISKSVERGNRIAEIGHAIEIFAITYYVGSMINTLLKDIAWVGTDNMGQFSVYAIVFVTWLYTRKWIKKWLAGKLPPNE